MKNNKLILATLAWLAVFLTAHLATAQTQRRCVIEPGKGCGEIGLGATRTALDGLLGTGVKGDYFAAGVSVTFVGEKADAITFVFDPGPFGYDQFKRFGGAAPGTTPAVLASKFGKPTSTRTNTVMEAAISTIDYPGAQYVFKNGTLYYVKVSRNTEPNGDFAIDVDFGSGGDKPAPKTESTAATEDDDERLTEKEIAERKKKLDGLKSNITFGLPPTPSPTPAPTPVPTPSPTPAPAMVRTGKLSDCKIILSSGCRNYFLAATLGQIVSETGLQRNASGNTVDPVHRGKGFDVTVEPSTDGIVTVEIRKASGWKPAENVKFGDWMSKVREKLGNGGYQRLYVGESLTYPDFVLLFEEGRLFGVVLSRQRNVAEEKAHKQRQAEYDAIESDRYWRKRREEEAAEARKTPQERAREFREAYDDVHGKVEAAARKIYSYKERAATWRSTPTAISEFEARKLEREASAEFQYAKALVDSFLARWGDRVPADVKAHLNEDLLNMSRMT